MNSNWWYRTGCMKVCPDATFIPPDGWAFQARWLSCPRVRVSGACCEGCASGGGCDARVGEEAYPWKLARDLNDQAVALNAELVKALKAVLAKEPNGNATWAQLTNEWGIFYPEWTTWFKDKSDNWGATGILGIISGESLTEFKAYVARFNQVAQHAKDAGVGGPSTEKFDTTSPLEQGLESGAKEAGGAIGKAAAYAGLVLGPLLIGAAVVLGVVAIGPYVAPILARKAAA